MMTYVPNTLSFSRIALALSLFVIIYALGEEVFGILFLTAYAVAGVTDMIDGPIARKFNVASAFGGNLDGIADYIFVAAALITIVPALKLNMLSIWLIAGFAALKILGMIVGYIRFRELMMMHTFLSKTGALLAFAFPIIMFVLIEAVGFTDTNTAFLFLVAFVYLFLIEEIAINIVMPEPKRDIKGIFEAIKIRKSHKPS
jgi:CDP-diacylglycerol--glycerol-3-phosphate 3-phosphatidyltransferase